MQRTWMNTSPRGHGIRGGIIAGLIGGAVLAALLVISNLVRGLDVWPVLKGAGTPFLHARAAAPGFDAVAVLVGVAAHFAISAIWGVLFGVLFFGLGKPATVAVGALWGVAVWFVMYYIVLPVAGLAQVAAATPKGPSILQHVVFGLVVGLAFLPFQRPRPLYDPNPVRY